MEDCIYSKYADDVSFGTRDAVHVPIICVYAGEGLNAGDCVKVRESTIEGKKVLVAFRVLNLIDGVGVVDPFGGIVSKGEKFWLCVKPGVVSPPRHVWEHPAFAFESDRDKAAARLDEIAASLGASTDELMEHADSYLCSGDYWCEGAKFDGKYIPDDFWDCYQIIRGKFVSDKGNFLSCSC